MREESLRIKVEGHLLHRLVLHPEEGVPVRAEAIFYHGQGDYAERYLDVLHPFTNRGIRCTVTELPGHGRSPGRRGHCGDADLLDAMILNTLETASGKGDIPYGVMGHSMGGLLAARHLVLAGQGKLPIPSFAWLSSPLVKPGNGRPDFFLKMARLLAPLVPTLTMSTHVTPEICRAKPKGGGGETDSDLLATASPPKHELWHSRISLGWGTSLLRFSELVSQGINDIPVSVPLLYTQGSEDPVCPSGLAREIFARLPNHTKQYKELEGMLHEPFRGDGSELLYAALDDWLDFLALSQ